MVRSRRSASCVGVPNSWTLRSRREYHRRNARGLSVRLAPQVYEVHLEALDPADGRF